jgi:hypothetical protein
MTDREISHEDFAARGDQPVGWHRSDLWRDPSVSMPFK